MLCPNCMSPYIEQVEPEPGEPLPDEQLLHCTECDYTAPTTDFLPENYR